MYSFAVHMNHIYVYYTHAPTGLEPTDILPSIDAWRLRNHPEFERQTRQIVGQVLTDKAFWLSKKVWRIGGIYWRYL